MIYPRKQSLDHNKRVDSRQNGDFLVKKYKARDFETIKSNSSQQSPVRYVHKTENHSSQNQTPEKQKQLKILKHFLSVNKLNEQYYQHISGRCRCSRCQCDPKLHKCINQDLKIDHLKQSRTEYKRDYPKYEQVTNSFNKFLPQQNFIVSQEHHSLDKNSKTHDDFQGTPCKQPQEEIVQIDRNNLKCSYIPIQYNTSYNSQFHKQVIPKNILYTPLKNIPSNNDIPFKKTPVKIDQCCQVKQINWSYDRTKKSFLPITLNIPANIMQRSTYQARNDFKNQRSYEIDRPIRDLSDNKKKNMESIFDQKQTSYEGMYKSKYKRDFDNLSRKEGCPASIEPPDLIQRLSRKNYRQ